MLLISSIGVESGPSPCIQIMVPVFAASISGPWSSIITPFPVKFNPGFKLCSQNLVLKSIPSNSLFPVCYLSWRILIILVPIDDTIQFTYTIHLSEQEKNLQSKFYKEQSLLKLKRYIHTGLWLLYIRVHNNLKHCYICDVLHQNYRYIPKIPHSLLISVFLFVLHHQGLRTKQTWSQYWQFHARLYGTLQ